MRTLIVSDLHLGGLSGIDVLRRPTVRAALLSALDRVDRVVLLGDVLELRHGPPHEALAGARPFFQELGAALGERELIITAGNHDHLLVSTWLDARALDQPQPLAVEQRMAAAEASPMAAQIARWAAPANVQVAYPGLWVRPDVYAMHGHFLDCHLTIPTLERLGVGVMSRLLERPEHQLDSVDAYEALTAPIYSWRDAMARYARTGPALNGVATVRAWRAIAGQGGRPASGASLNGAGPAGRDGARSLGSARRGPGEFARHARGALRSRAVKRGFPLAVSMMNRAGLGPLSPDISGPELRRAGLRAMGEVAARLGLGESYLIFGHTHRAGPFAGDDPAEWHGRAGARLVNCGCWTYDSVFLAATPGDSPYWPGTCAVVEDSGAPELRRLLIDCSHEELAPAPA